MRTLSALLNSPKKLKDGDVGIEIEMEGKQLYAARTFEAVSHLWNIEDDGSLRGRYPDSKCEYVLKNPLSVEASKEALAKMEEMLAGNEAVVNDSPRTSVHIHMNVQRMTHSQYCNLVYTYLLLENALATKWGERRIANRFCLRLRDAEDAIDHLKKVFNNDYWLLELSEENIRYAAINLACFKKYGSIEFRGMRGTTDKAVIGEWIDILFQLKDYACSVKDVHEVRNDLMTIGASKWAKKALGNFYNSFNKDVVYQSVVEAYSLSMDLPMAYVCQRYQYEDYVEQPKVEVKAAKKEVVDKAPIWPNADQWDADQRAEWIDKEASIIWHDSDEYNEDGDVPVWCYDMAINHLDKYAKEAAEYRARQANAPVNFIREAAPIRWQDFVAEQPIIAPGAEAIEQAVQQMEQFLADRQHPQEWEEDDMF